jgi:hypothetical protein
MSPAGKHNGTEGVIEMRRERARWTGKTLKRGLPQSGVDGESLMLAKRDGRTVAHVLATSGTIPRDRMTPEVLALANANENGYTVAHLLAECGELPQECMTPEALPLMDYFRRTVAYELAESGILRLRTA